ncbi:MAG: SDR family oxidoreductase [Dehalococcoidales bacterium]|nr:SDR family oxidoreductase [Dehalococcoidales bacterium]
MDYGLKDKVAIVTGTGSQIGFGKAIALTLANEGCRIVSCDIDIDGARKTVDEIEALGGEAVAMKVDVTNGEEVNAMVKATIEEFGRVDIMAANAGHAFASGPFADQKEEDWDKDIGLNLKGVMLCARAVLPYMLERNYGKIIATSSGAAKRGAPGVEAYGASKAGVGGFCKSLALSVAARGINVNSVAPAIAVTNFIGGKISPGVQMMIDEIPQKRATVPQDVANVVAFLASDVSSHITAQMISVDGGATTTQ